MDQELSLLFWIIQGKHYEQEPFPRYKVFPVKHPKQKAHWNLENLNVENMEAMMLAEAICCYFQ